MPERQLAAKTKAKKAIHITKAHRTRQRPQSLHEGLSEASGCSSVKTTGQRLQFGLQTNTPANVKTTLEPTH